MKEIFKLIAWLCFGMSIGAIIDGSNLIAIYLILLSIFIVIETKEE